MIEIYRDNFGVPHIMCDTFKEGAKATAICHCEDDFFTLQLWLLAVFKKAGHFDDWDGAYLDFLYEFFNIKEAIVKIKPNISKEYLLAVESYCQGINEFASANKKEVLDDEIFPITPDKILEAQHLLEIIGIQLDKPYSFLTGPKKRSTQTIPTKEGSNVVALSGKHTENGDTFLAVSPHQPLEGIYSFYELHVYYRQTQQELFGFILPITFTIFMGTNFQIAWGSTASYPDMYSIYEVKLKGLIKKKLLVEEGQIPLTSHIYRNYISFYEKIPLPFIKRYYRTIEGNPVIKVKNKYYLIDIPLIGYCLGTELNYRLSTASNVEEALTILKKFRYPYLDVVIIDTSDDLLFVHNSHEPIRQTASEYRTDTIQLKSLSQLPKEFEDALLYVINPQSGYICCANQSPLHTDNTSNKAYQGLGLHYNNENSRSIRIKNLLDHLLDIKKLRLEDLITIFTDTKIQLPIVRGIDFSIIYSIFEKGDLGKLISILQNWDGHADVDSEGAAVFSLLYYRYKDQYFIYHKDPDKVQVATEIEIKTCLNWVKKVYKDSETLGDIQSIQRGKVSFPIGGIPDSINTIRSYYDRGRLIAEEGCAFKMFVDLQNRDIRTCHPYGASSNETSEHYTSQLRMFVDNEYKELKPMTYYQRNYTTKSVIKQ